MSTKESWLATNKIIPFTGPVKEYYYDYLMKVIYLSYSQIDLDFDVGTLTFYSNSDVDKPAEWEVPCFFINQNTFSNNKAQIRRLVYQNKLYVEYLFINKGMKNLGEILFTKVMSKLPVKNNIAIMFKRHNGGNRSKIKLEFKHEIVDSMDLLICSIPDKQDVSNMSPPNNFLKKTDFDDQGICLKKEFWQSQTQKKSQNKTSSSLGIEYIDVPTILSELLEEERDNLAKVLSAYGNFIDYEYVIGFPILANLKQTTTGIGQLWLIKSKTNDGSHAEVYIINHSLAFLSTIAVHIKELAISDFQERERNINKKHSTRIAIISILVDSFAHNIAAHSLSAMVWFLKQHEEKKNELINELKVNRNNAKKFEIAVNNISNYLETTKINKLFEELNNSENENLRDAIEDISNHLKNVTPMEGSVQYAQYLCNKAAFWSGVTRDFECGGEIRTWYDVLNDFADNPLFLGTIAHSEGIHKVKINVGCRKDSNPCTLKEFHIIDLDYMFPEKSQDSPTPAGGDEVEGVNNGGKPETGASAKEGGGSKQGTLSKDGKDKEKIKKELIKDEWRLFLPNGIVGQHAFYTIFENTIRNIKHAANLDEQKKKGIEFNIFIESFDDKRFNTIVWLGNKSKIMEGKKDEEGNVVKDEKGNAVMGGVDERIGALLEKEIISDSNRPRMGGNSQDKICASMLYNNIFSKVDVNDQDNPKRTYRWWIGVKRDPENNEELGVIKRSFDVWKGAYAVEIMPDTAETDAVERTTSAISSEDEEKIVKIKVGELEYENPARFKFVIVPKSEEKKESKSKEKDLKVDLAKKGIVRIMEKSECSGDDLDFLYKAWNKKWIKYDKKVYLVRGITAASSISSENKNPWVTNYHPGEVEEGIIVGSKICRFCHDENDKPPEGKAFLTRKSHCVLSTKFTYLGDKKEDRLEIRGEGIGHEFIETLLTHIEIYDNRIYNRVHITRDGIDLIKLYTEQLFLNIYNENIFADEGKIMRQLKAKDENSKTNFIIIHLSYIKSLSGDDEDINKFIEEYFKDFLSDNSKLVITTGRGRGGWHENLNGEYKPHVLFKPIDSLLNAVEDGLMLKDDFQVKYNLVKILFGS